MAFTIDLLTWLKSVAYTEEEVDTLLDGKSDVGHTHGDLYYTETEVDTLLAAKADTDDIPTDVSELNNDAGYITSADISGKEDASNKVTTLSSASTDTQYPSAKVVYDELAEKADADDIPTVVSELTNDAGYLVATDIAGKEDTTNKVTSLSSSSTDTQYPSAKVVYDGLAAKANSADLATVATSGSYDDLSDKPTLDDLGGEVTVEKQATAESGYAATYVIKQDGTQVGSKINIPKDFLVKSATLETCTTQDEPVPGYVVGDKYLDFVINTKEGDGTAQHIYILVSDLIDTYTADESTLTLSNANVFSIKDGGVGSTQLASNAVTTAKITDANVTRAKLASAVTDELDSKLEASDIDVQFNTTTGVLTIDVGSS